MTSTEILGLLDKAKPYGRGPLPFFVLVAVLGFATSFLKEVPGWAVLLFLALVVGLFVFVLVKYPGHLYPISDYGSPDEFRKALTLGTLDLAATTRSVKEIDSPAVNLVKAIPASVEIIPRQDAWKKRILWVDDQPDNNRLERLAFRRIGIQYDLACNTEEALALLRRRQYRAIISDFSRKHETAGYRLLDEVRQDRDANALPLFIYTSAAAPAPRSAGANQPQGWTNEPQKLFVMITEHLFRSA